MKLQSGDRAGTLTAYQESLDITRKLAARDQGDARAQRDLSVSLQNVGNVNLQSGDRAGALIAYQECLDISRKLAAQDRGNAHAQRDVSVSLTNLGDVKLQSGDRAGAIAAYQESLDIARKLAAQDQGDALVQFVLATSLLKMITVVDPAQAQSMLTEVLSILEKLDREQKLPPTQKAAFDKLRSVLSKQPGQNLAVPPSDRLHPRTNRH